MNKTSISGIIFEGTVCIFAVEPFKQTVNNVSDDLCKNADGSLKSGAPFQKEGDCYHFNQCSNGI